jgi:hypothetical protein
MISTTAISVVKPPRNPWRRIMWFSVLLIFIAPLLSRAALYAFEPRLRGFYEARWSSTGFLPPAESDPEPRVLVFAARNGFWTSIFAVHTWIVVKPANGPYTRYEVSHYRGPILINGRVPDGLWMSNMPYVVADVRGPAAETAIPKIEAAVRDYAYAKSGDYRIWPGPNSNTFVATVLRAAPELQIALPAIAIGKDYRADNSMFGVTPSRTGIEFELFGLLGVKAGWVEGIEINFLTLVAGLDIRKPALKLPGIDRIGLGMLHAATANPR